jgi:diguanylate cyclase (GGDEF)-like protein
LGLLAMGLVSLAIFRTNQKQMRALSRKSDLERKLMDEQLRLAREVKLLGELNEWLQSSRSLDELFDMVSKFMTHILPNAEGSVYVYSNSRDVLDGWASWNGGDHKDHIHPDSCWGLRRGRVYEYGSGEVTFVCEHAEPHDGRPYFCFPILAHGETVGLMHLRAHSADCENFAANKKLARMCAEQISMAISNVQMRDQLHDQSVRDPLTGLFNRRHMTDSLRKGISRCQSQGSRLSLIAIDVDHFKKFNDNHGHDAGDMVLRAVGSVLEQACDGDEVACRPGGEEFTLILPDTTPEDALTRAELVRQAVEEVTVRYGEKALPRVTISIGVSHYPSHGTMPQDLMRAADEALYEAKARGRNQVYVANQNDSVITPVEGTAETPGKKSDAA